ncbi:nuclear transport factor 2 family protein [Ketobacter sp. MCCC 1A13808]|uniref:nuclear transport factor 2 family protein n=1 Tax=Ketobacter sp. MCCC 1A13808 TaxID=2602738 RepID=UPI0012EB26EA|nr:nuclear transport factor 2 family protein [Ketobacter sp. MCCC 1A13808]MVF13231.1 nuclear transport factor 2 family protein [Ketobacter sp. MCCC 1A13808]
MRPTKRDNQYRTAILLSIVAVVTMVAGCTASDKRNSGAENDPVKTYLHLAPAATFDKPSSDPRLQSFEKLFSSLNETSIQDTVDEAYAEYFYFNDTFHTLSDRVQLKRYLLGMAEVSKTQVTVLDSLSRGDDVMVRWKMQTQSKVWWKTLTIDSFGMTHLRFNEQGQIVLHQDYWDAAGGFYEHLPLLGSSIRSIRSNLNE